MTVSNLIGLAETGEGRNKQLFLDCLQLVERLHRRLLDVIKSSLDAEGATDINSVQALLLYNIGDNEMTAGELRTRGYYLGSNVSYNLKKLVEMGFISHQPAEHDKRAVRIALTDKGRTIATIVNDLYDEQLKEVLEDEIFDLDEFRHLRRNLRNLERFWSDQLRFI